MKLVVMKSQDEYKYLKVDPRQGVLWVNDISAANSYPSKYSAKKHMKSLDGNFESVRFYQVNG